MTETASLPAWPMFGLVNDVRPALARAIDGGRTVALATIYEVIGGSPRPVGSQMLIDDGEPHGFLSGGCIEADICMHAREVRRTGEPRRLIYGEGGPFPDIRLVCGGRIDILLERLTADNQAVQALLALGEQRREAVWLSDGVNRLCYPAAAPPAAEGPFAPLILALSDPLTDCAVLGQDRAVGLSRAPRRRLVVVGGDPIALAVASLAVQSEFETWLVRPKGPAEPPPLPGVHYDRRAAETALSDIRLDRWTHVAVATHDLSADEPALLAALRSDAAYVGALGARRRLPERKARLRAQGVSETALARLHAPIGLDLGGKAPFEIAISVLAEIIGEANAPRPGAWRRVALPSEATAA